MSLVGVFKRNGASGFGYNSTAEEVTEGLSLRGRTILITGCNSGLGAETMRVLCARGARVIGAARTLEKAAAACGGAPGEVLPLACELSEPASVRAAIAGIRKIGGPLDAVIANAGIMALPKLVQKHGYELQFLTNHLGHHLFVTGLLDRLAESGRIVMLTSGAHRMAPPEGIRFDNLSGEKDYSPWGAYGQSKLANLLFARHLAKRLPLRGQTANAVHPGIIHTALSRHFSPVTRAVFSALSPLFLKNVAQGAATQCYVAVHPAAASQSGAYFEDCNVAESSKAGQDADLAAALWEKTEAILAGLR